MDKIFLSMKGQQHKLKIYIYIMNKKSPYHMKYA